MHKFILALLLGLPAAAQTTRLERLDADRKVLDYGLWNGRINALYDLGELGRDGLDTLAYADDDADWQVRLTAVHFLGKAGTAAAPELAAIASREPCPHVRLYALLSLSRMGPAGKAYYDSAITPEDEEALKDLGGYRPEMMGKPVVIDAPDGGMTAAFFNGGLDLRVCASSEHAGRLHLHREDLTAGSGANETVVTADVPRWAREGKPRPAARIATSTGAPETFPDAAAIPARAMTTQTATETPAQKRKRLELDAILAPGKSEELPASKALPMVAAIKAKGEPRFETPGARTLKTGSVAGVSSGTAEAFPPGNPGFSTPESAKGTADFVADAGTGKPENDPIPVLIAQLKDADPRRRARAADELGKRGPAARVAVPALHRALKDGDRRVRASAVLALGSAGGEAIETAADLRRALRDKDEDVRFSAAIALERLRAASSR